MTPPRKLPPSFASDPASDPASKRVVVCIDTRDGPGRERLRGVYHFALNQNWRLVLMRREYQAAAQQLTTVKLDGAILFDRPAALHRYLRRRRIPCIETSARNLPLVQGAVFADDAAIGQAAADHLRRMGFEHFGYCGLAGALPSQRRATELAGWLRQQGQKLHPLEERNAEGEASLHPLMRWLRDLPKPAGVLTYDDKMAERVLAACRWANLAVPDQVGVLGIGNDEVICELSHPRLSSITLPAWQVGHKAAELLAAAMGDQPPSDRPLVALPPGEVIIRASTDRVAAVDPAVRAAVEMVRVHFGRPLGTDEIAAAAGVPRRTLERRFQRELGQTVHAYLAELRIRHAKALLRQPGMALGEVARRCGYSAQSAFTIMFATVVGRHPRDYRDAVAGGM